MAFSHQPAMANVTDDVRIRRQTICSRGRRLFSSRIWITVIYRLFVSLLAVLPPACAAVDFTRDIQPIFRKKCVGCHGGVKSSSGLRLDVREAALSGGYSGAVIVPGKAMDSSLYRLVA